jgi:hypothetical protein
MEAYGVKESLEALEALKLLAIEASKVLEDGKVNIKDLPVLFDLMRKMNVIKAGTEGADQIMKEVKDLSQEESLVLLNKVYEVVGALKQLKA